MPSKKNIADLSRISLDQYQASEKKKRLILADNIRSMHNIGSLFRTADAFRWQGIILCGITGTPPHPDLHKTALGAEESVMWQHAQSSIQAVKQLKDEGWKICVLEQVHDSIPLHQFHPSEKEKLVLVAGNEVEGVDQNIVDLADYILEIPQEGTKHSLNVSVATAMAMYQINFLSI